LGITIKLRAENLLKNRPMSKTFILNVTRESLKYLATLTFGKL